MCHEILLALLILIVEQEEQTTKQYLRLAGADISKETLVSFEKMMLKVRDIETISSG